MPVSEKPRKATRNKNQRRPNKRAGRDRSDSSYTALDAETVDSLIAGAANPEEMRQFLEGKGSITIKSIGQSGNLKAQDFLKRLNPHLDKPFPTTWDARADAQIWLKAQRELSPGAKSNPIKAWAGDAVDLAVALSAHALGLLAKDPVVGSLATMDAALVEFNTIVASNRSLQSLIPGDYDEGESRGYVVNRSEKAKRGDVYRHFFPKGRTTTDYIYDRVRVNMTASAAEREAQRQYWLTIFEAATAFDGLADRQHSARHRVAADLRAGRQASWADRQICLGEEPQWSNDPVTALDRLVVMAWFNLPTIQELIPTMAAHSEKFRAAALLGKFARFGLGQIPSETGRVLRPVLSCNQVESKSKRTVSFGDEPIRLLSATAFLRESMLQIEGEEWWRKKLKA